MSQSELDNLLSTGLMAQRIGALPSQLMRLSNQGLIPFKKLNGKRLFNINDADAIIRVCVERGFIRTLTTPTV